MGKTKAEILTKLHDSENAFNKEIGRIDKQIRELGVRKNKLNKMISNNMKARNKIINEADYIPKEK